MARRRYSGGDGLFRATLGRGAFAQLASDALFGAPPPTGGAPTDVVVTGAGVGVVPGTVTLGIQQDATVVLAGAALAVSAGSASIGADATCGLTGAALALTLGTSTVQGDVAPPVLGHTLTVADGTPQLGIVATTQYYAGPWPDATGSGTYTFETLDPLVLVVAAVSGAAAARTAVSATGHSSTLSVGTGQVRLDTVAAVTGGMLTVTRGTPQVAGTATVVVTGAGLTGTLGATQVTGTATVFGTGALVATAVGTAGLQVSAGVAPVGGSVSLVVGTATVRVDASVVVNGLLLTSTTSGFGPPPVVVPVQGAHLAVTTAQVFIGRPGNVTRFVLGRALFLTRGAVQSGNRINGWTYPPGNALTLTRGTVQLVRSTVATLTGRMLTTQLGQVGVTGQAVTPITGMGVSATTGSVSTGLGRDVAVGGAALGAVTGPATVVADLNGLIVPLGEVLGLASGQPTVETEKTVSPTGVVCTSAVGEAQLAWDSQHDVVGLAATLTAGTAPVWVREDADVLELGTQVLFTVGSVLVLAERSPVVYPQSLTLLAADGESAPTLVRYGQYEVVSWHNPTFLGAVSAGPSWTVEGGVAPTLAGTLQASPTAGGTLEVLVPEVTLRPH